MRKMLLRVAMAVGVGVSLVSGARAQAPNLGDCVPGGPLQSPIGDLILYYDSADVCVDGLVSITIPLGDIEGSPELLGWCTPGGPAEVISVVQAGSPPEVGPFYGTAVLRPLAEDILYTGTSMTDADCCVLNSIDRIGYTARCGPDNADPPSPEARGYIYIVVTNSARPVAVNDSYSTMEDAPLSVAAPGVLENDTLTPCREAAVRLVTGPAVGSLTLNGDGSFTYAPPANYCGPATFTYEIVETAENVCAALPLATTVTSGVATVTIDVMAVNDAPVAVNDAYSFGLVTNSVAAPGVLANDTDVDALNGCGCTNLVATLVQQAAHGVVTLNSDGSFTYIVNDPAFCGTDSFTYMAMDSECDPDTLEPLPSNVATVTLTVGPPNQCPERRDSYTDIQVNFREDTYQADCNGFQYLDGTNYLFVTQPVLVTDRFVDPDEFFQCNPYELDYEVELPAPQGITATIGIENRLDLAVVVEDLLQSLGEGCYRQPCQPVEIGRLRYFVTDRDLVTCPLEDVYGEIVFNWIPADLPPVAPTLQVSTMEDVALTLRDVDILRPAYEQNPNSCCTNFIEAVVGCCPALVPDCGDEDSYLEELVLDFWPMGEFQVTTDGGDVLTFTNMNLTELTTAMGGTATLDGSQMIYTPPADWPRVGCQTDYIPYVIRDLAQYGEVEDHCGTISSCTSDEKIAIGLIEVEVCAVCDPIVAGPDIVPACEDTDVSISLQSLLDNDTSVDFTGNLIAFTGNTLIGSEWLGTDAPPAFVQGFEMTPFDVDLQAAVPNGQTRTTIPTGLLVDGNLTFSAPGVKRTIGAGWASWSHGYTGPVWQFASSSTVTLFLPPNTAAFAFHVEPQDFGMYEVYAVANDGSESDRVLVEGNSGAQGLAFFAQQPGQVIQEIRIVVDPAADGFAIAEFMISQQPIAYVCNVGGLVGPSNGELIISGYVSSIGSIATNLVYRPYAGFFGEDRFSYTVCVIRECDGQLRTEYITGMVTVQVAPVSDFPPVANDDAFATDEDTPLVIDPAELLANDHDGGDQGLNARNLAPETLCIYSFDAESEQGGTLEWVDGMVVYMPAEDYYGWDSFTYTISDQRGTAQNATQPGMIDYACGDDRTPCNDGNVVEEFATATVYICVLPVNDPAEPMPDNYDIQMNTTLTGNVLENDFDKEGGMTAHLHPLVNVTHGSLVFDEDGSFTYIPFVNWYGTDGFTYYVVDEGQTIDCGNGPITSPPNTSMPIRVYIQVGYENICPTADAKFVTTPEDAPVNVQLTGNDPEEYGYIQGYVIGDEPASGTLSVPNGGMGSVLQVVYTPDANFCGTDEFTYAAIDNVGCTSAFVTVTISVTPVNDAPVANDVFVTTPEDTAVVISPAANDTDADRGTVCGADINRIVIIEQPMHGSLVRMGMQVTYYPNPNWHGVDQFVYQVFDAANAFDFGTVVIEVSPVNDAPVAYPLVLNTPEDTAIAGQLVGMDVDGDALTYSILANGSLGVATILDASAGTFAYAPNPCRNGIDTFTFQVSDGELTASAEVTVHVIPVNAPPIAAHDIAGTDVDVPVVIDVLANDDDGDCDEDQPLLVSIAAGPSHGSVEVNADQTVTYTPNEGVCGVVDTFSYYVTDVPDSPQQARESAVANVTISVRCVNRAPVAQNQTVNLYQHYNWNPTGGQLLASDPDGDELSYDLVQEPGKGTVTINQANGAFVFRAAPTLNGEDTFTYRVSDPDGLSAIGTVLIYITPTRIPILFWPETPGATWYRVFIRRNGENFVDTWVQEARWAPTEDLRGGDYTWWVQPWGPSIGYGDWSGEAQFNIPEQRPPVPGLVAPTGAQVSSTLDYRWTKDPSATWYRLQIERAGGSLWHDRWYPLTGAGEASVTLAGAPAGSLLWRVQGWSPDGSGPWSDKVAFSTPSADPAQAVLVGPQGVIATTSPTYAWQAAAQTDWYRVYVQRGSTVVIDQWTQGTSLASPSALSSGAYRWWVGTWNSVTETTVWSAQMNFTIP